MRGLVGRRTWTGKQWCGGRIGKGAVQHTEMWRQERLPGSPPLPGLGNMIPRYLLWDIP